MQRKWSIALAVVLLVGSMFLLWRWQGERDGYEEEIAGLRDENLELRERLEVLENDGDGDEPIEMPRPWSREGLEHHPQVEQMKAQGQEAGYSPGTTSWMPLELEIPPKMSQVESSTYTEPGSLVRDLTGMLGYEESLGQDLWQVTTRVLIDDDEATAVIMLWGFMDDSVAGTDLLVQMEREEDRWAVVSLQQRHHCRRAVTEDGRMCQ
ncbi:MAG: hypothetical protein R6U70_09165 [Bacillota bacterium]